MAANKKTTKPSVKPGVKPGVKKTAKKQVRGVAKKSGGKAPEKISIAHEFKKIFTGILILVGVVAVFAMVVDIYVSRNHVGRNHGQNQIVSPGKTTPDRMKTDQAEVKKRTSKKPDQRATQRAAKHPVFEVFDDTEEIPARPPEPLEPEPDFKDKIPRVAIIIDDIGFDKKISLALADLDLHLTLSILPGAPHAREIAEILHAKGMEILLHLPMEPMEYPRVDPGPGALLSTMTPDELLDQLRTNLDAIPHVSGVNNHMGSRMTSLSPQMNQIFTVLKQRDLFFIDSLTARNSLCRPAARLLQVSFARRDVFLDNIQDVDYIKKQLDQLLELAILHGTAIGIGHPYKATYLTLKSEMARLKTKIRIVPASALVGKISG